MTKKLENPYMGKQNPRGNKTGTTAAAYATAKCLNVMNYSKILFHILETGGAQSLKYKVEASVCGSVWHEVVAETTVAASADEYETITDAWSLVRVRVVDGSGHATYNVCWQLKE